MLQEKKVRAAALGHLIKTATNCLKSEERKIAMQMGSSPKNSSSVLSPTRLGQFSGRRSSETKSCGHNKGSFVATTRSYEKISVSNFCDHLERAKSTERKSSITVDFNDQQEQLTLSRQRSFKSRP